MLVELFRKLPAAGSKGLEGLVAEFVGDALGLEARLEGSGRQDGRDIGLFDRKTGERRNISTASLPAALVDDLQDEAFRNGFDILVLERPRLSVGGDLPLASQRNTKLT